MFFTKKIVKGMRYALPGLALLMMFLNLNCGYTIQGNPEVSLTSVTLTPLAIRIAPKSSFTLHATIANYLHDNTLQWFVLKGNGGTLQGSADSAVYTAPDTLATDPLFLTIRVQSTEDTSAHADCQVLVTASDTISGSSFYLDPNSVTIPEGAKWAFKLKPNAPSVKWIILSGPGSISQDGLYIGSPTGKSPVATIEAISKTDTNQTATATIILRSTVDTSICFSRDVQPILNGSCGMSGCHGGGGGSFSLTSYAGAAHEVVPGNARASRLYTAITQINQNLRMPPPPHPALTQSAIKTIGLWIDMGALDCQ